MTQKISAHKTHLVELVPQVYHLTLQHDALNGNVFEAGQYLNICMPDGSERPFSIASSPSVNGTIELIIRVANEMPATLQILDYLQNSDEIAIELPMGQCIIPRQGDLCFVAGGTGIAPIRAMLQSLAASKDSRQIDLFWGVQQQADFFLLDSIEKEINTLQHATLHLVCASPSGDWPGDKGFVHQCMLSKISDFSDKQIIIGGSMDMVKAVYLDLITKGVPEQQIHSDMIDIMRQFGGLPTAN